MGRHTFEGVGHVIMEAAPHDFGGHKVEAIEAARKAVAQLKAALGYRARHDK